MDLHDTDAKFGFLLDVEGLCYGTAADNNYLEKKCEHLGELFSSNVDRQQLYEETLDCRTLLSSRTSLKNQVLESFSNSLFNMEMRASFQIFELLFR